MQVQARFSVNPLAAFRALGALRQDPDDTKQVFTIIEALPGFAPLRVARGFRSSPEGMRLLESQPDILPLLSNREALAEMPPGSLGRAYLAFMVAGAITADGLVAASEGGSLAVDEGDPMFAFVHKRMRDTHDLWHVATGYGPDVKGELGLLAFNAAQMHHLGIALIVTMAVLHRKVPGAFALALEGFRRGRRAAWLPAVRWEDLLPRPLSEVRALLRLGEAPTYEPLYASDLVERGH